MIELGYAPTVRSNPVPLYMRGWFGLPAQAGLGQDDSSPIVPADVSIDVSAPPDFGSPSFSSSPGIFAPTDPTLQPLIDSGLSPDAASLVADAASSGAITNAQFQQIIGQKMSATDIENLILGSGTFAAVPGAPTGANRPPASAGAAVQAVSAASSAVKTALAPGPAPRVATGLPGANPLTQSSVIAGLAIPNLALLAIGGIILLGATKR